MSNRYDPKKVESYREAAIKLHEETLRVDRAIDDAAITGDLPAAEEALDNLTAQGEEVQKLRDTLTPNEIFMAKYNVEVINSHTVSFVLPQGVSRLAILQEAQGIVKERNLIRTDYLAKWARDPEFTQSSAEAERFVIDGHVEGSEDKTRAKHEEFLKSKKLEMPELKDLAVASAAHFVATGEPISGWANNQDTWGYVVRAVGGALYFASDGLNVDDHDGYLSGSDVAVASRATPELKN